MAATIKIKNSSTAGAAPTSSDLVQGELAVNVTDKRLFTENSGGTVVELGTNPSSITLPDGSASAPTLLHSGDTNTGLFFPAADTIALTTGGSERLRLDSSGNLGLGVTPSAWAGGYKALDLNAAALAATTGAGNVILSNNSYYNGTNYIYKATGVASDYVQTGGQHWWRYASSGSAGGTITFTQAMTLDASGNLALNTTSPTNPANKNFTVNGGSTDAAFVLSVADTRIGQLYAATSEVRLSAVTSVPLTFRTADAERARITAGGYFKASNVATYIDGTGVFHEFYGGGANGYTLIVSSPVATPLSQYMFDMRFTAAAPNNTSARFWNCGDTGATRAYMASNGGLYNYQANNSNLSDRREKTNFAPAGDYLAKICAIPVQTFNYIDQNLEEDDGLTLGVVAQDVQAVAPELVHESNWAGKDEEPKMRLSIYQTDLQYALMKSIQELKAIVDAQAAEIAALKG